MSICYYYCYRYYYYYYCFFFRLSLFFVLFCCCLIFLLLFICGRLADKEEEEEADADAEADAEVEETHHINKHFRVDLEHDVCDIREIPVSWPERALRSCHRNGAVWQLWMANR